MYAIRSYYATMTYAYTNVAISEPSPVKEFSMPQMPTNGQMPSQDDIQKMMEQAEQMGGEDQ